MRVVELKQIAKISAGQGAPKEFSEEGTPFVRAGHLSELISGLRSNDLPCVSEDTAKRSKLKLYPSGSVVFAKSGMSSTKNRVWILDSDCFVVSHLCIIEPKKEQLDGRYALRFFQWFGPSRLIKDESYPSISLKDIGGIMTPLPPLEEQKRIAGILDEADRVRKKTQALIDKYDELAQSLFLDMFGDPVTNPKGWKLRTVDECCLVTDYVANGSFASLKANVRYNYDKDFAVLVRTTDNTKGWNGNYVYVPESSFHFLSKSELSKGDLIIANVGDPGKCFLCPDLGQPMTLGPNSILVRSLVDKLNQPYLYHLFASSSGQKMIDRICSATAQKKFNKTSFRALEIPVPDAKTLDKFGQVIETHERQIGYEKNQLNKTEALFNALLQKAFKGELT